MDHAAPPRARARAQPASQYSLSHRVERRNRGRTSREANTPRRTSDTWREKNSHTQSRIWCRADFRSCRLSSASSDFRPLRLDDLAAMIPVHPVAPGEYLGKRWIFADLVEINHPHWRLKDEKLLRSRLEKHQHRRGGYVGASECITDQVFASAQGLLKTRQDPRDSEPALLFLEW